MPPRKTAASTDEAAAPRRSSRAATVKSGEDLKSKETSVKKRKATGDDKAINLFDAIIKAKPETDEEKDEEEDEEAVAPALEPIDIGDSLPSLTLKNEKDEDVDVATLTAEKGLVLFLVPKADTPGCTKQACAFRDIYPDFTGLDYDVYCLSADTPAAQTKWQAKKELPYPLLSDRKRVLITALGAGEGGKTKRSHFIFGKGGKLLDKKLPVKPEDSPKLALEFIKSQ
ncbi:AhpC-TSA-domain-containing protein [Mycena indigotica]|uniref:thioredoxin-dependent peroxiredoxin n=1 Tax=Mycena indigotica TaxID=2126181 RepID=A0A8H6SR78_9AGAR|nr:AhpC-TSA-domain-containing protein [Mycena indigotica]KAF7303919.1 AhpC-TSA-domain-containing protein [Mycena indigotica]